MSKEKVFEDLKKAVELNDGDAVRSIMGSDTMDKESRKYVLSEVDDQGNTLLHVAASKGLVNSVQSLVNWGADIDVKNNEKQTPRELAESVNRGWGGFAANIATAGMAGYANTTEVQAMLEKAELEKIEKASRAAEAKAAKADKEAKKEAELNAEVVPKEKKSSRETQKDAGKKIRQDRLARWSGGKFGKLSDQSREELRGIQKGLGKVIRQDKNRGMAGKVMGAVVNEVVEAGNTMDSAVKAVKKKIFGGGGRGK